MENQAVILTHKWPGIASSIIGITSIIITLLVIMIAAEPTPMTTALQLLMLGANLIGIALGFFGAKDRSSRKLYPLLGLTLNVAIPMAFVTLALVTIAQSP